MVFAVFADAVVAPFNKLAFKFATTVFELTTNGAVPVAILDTICPAVPKLPTLALPETFAVPVIFAPVPVTTNTLAVPTAEILTLAFATTVTLLLPLVSIPVK